MSVSEEPLFSVRQDVFVIGHLDQRRELIEKIDHPIADAAQERVMDVGEAQAIGRPANMLVPENGPVVHDDQTGPEAAVVGVGAGVGAGAGLASCRLRSVKNPRK